MTIEGTHGNDTLTGTSGNDSFNVSQGGNDTVSGLGGNDIIYFGAAFTAADSADGGAGTDTLRLTGDYSAGVTFGASTLLNVEQMQLGTGFSYDLITNDATVASGARLKVDAHTLGTSDSLTFNGAAESNGTFYFIGGTGNDTLTGGTGVDTFDLSYGGEDHVTGGAGNDVIDVGAALDSGDHIDGGSGNDIVVLKGNYSGAHAVTLSATTLVNVETIKVAPGFNYDITLSAPVSNANSNEHINGYFLGAGNSLHFDASAVSGQVYTLDGGAGNDVLLAAPSTGSSQGDLFDLHEGGNDTAQGSSSHDVFKMGTTLNAGDMLDGGGGGDTLELSGDYSTPVVLGATTLTNIGGISLQPGFTYDIVENDGNVAAGQTLGISGARINNETNIIFDGSAETDGHFIFEDSGDSTNVFIGGAQSDKFFVLNYSTNTVTGGGGADTISIGGNITEVETFKYNAVSDSTSTGYDTYLGIQSSDFVMHVSPIGAVTGVDAKVSGGALSTATFDSDLAAAVGASQLAAHHAVLFAATSGTLSGHTFLVVDENGTAGYQAGGDLVMDVTGLTAITMGEFS
ncbi:MAG TPA: calcium-binding protein [Rhizomicrobium sp.]|jgi:hypothetical protein